ncbi:hypothetical protein [Polaromonas sp.]|uniref:hypothetical protein n=1 Tax=Polaromonas sp. TaxID=1869339 RepID=UPI0032631722
MRFTIILSTLLLCSACNETSSQPANGIPAVTPAASAASTASTAQAGTLVLPDIKEATQAFLEMMELQKYKDAELKLGTCIPAVQAKHPGQVACTVALKIGAGTSETQADFYRQGNKWVAQPSSSQDLLPFPDPKL